MARYTSKRNTHVRKQPVKYGRRRKMGVSMESIVNRMRRENPQLSAFHARKIVKLTLKKGLESGLFTKRQGRWFLGNPKCSHARVRGSCAHTTVPKMATHTLLPSLLKDYTSHVHKSHASLRRHLLDHLEDMQYFISRKHRRDRSKDWQFLDALELSMFNTLIRKYVHQRKKVRDTGLRHLAHYLHEVHPATHR